MNIGDYNMMIMKLIKDVKHNLSYRFVRYHLIWNTLWKIKNKKSKFTNVWRCVYVKNEWRHDNIYYPKKENAMKNYTC